MARPVYNPKGYSSQRFVVYAVVCAAISIWMGRVAFASEGGTRAIGMFAAVSGLLLAVGGLYAAIKVRR